MPVSLKNSVADTYSCTAKTICEFSIREQFAGPYKTVCKVNGVKVETVD